MAPLRSARAKDARIRSPRRYLSSYDAAHLLADEYNSAQKEKQLSRERSQYSSNMYEDSYQRSGQKEPISPYSSAKKYHSQNSITNYQTVDERSPVVRKLEMKYYDNKYAHQKPCIVTTPSSVVSFHPSQVQRKNNRILENMTSRYVPDYTPFQ